MKPFTFKLQTVLDLRERREQDAAMELALARSAEAEANMAQAAARTEHESMHAQATRATCSAELMPAGELNFYRTVLEHLEHRTDEAARAATEATSAAVLSARLHQQAVQDRSMMDRLEERQREAWRQAMAASDRNAMDAVALNRHLMLGRTA